MLLNDPAGTGKTQIWLGLGEASLDRSQLDTEFNGQNRSALLQRTQPLIDNIALVASAGLSSYERPGDDFTSVNLGLGILASIR